MTSIDLTENNTRCYGVTFRNIGWIKVQNLKVPLIINIIYIV